MTSLSSKNIDYYNNLERVKINMNHPIRLKPLLDYEDILIGNKENLQILDIGCGVGRDSYRFFLEGANVTSLDISQKNLDQINFDCKKICGSAEDLSNIDDNSYDVVFCRALLHHLENPVIALSEMRRKLKKGGLFLCSEPLSKNFLLNIGREWRVKYDNRLEEQSNFTNKEYKKLLESAGITKIRTKSFFSFFNVIFQSISVASKRLLKLDIDIILYGFYLDTFFYIDQFIVGLSPDQGIALSCTGVNE